MRRMQSRPNPSGTIQQELTPERAVAGDPPGHLAAGKAAGDVRDEVERSGVVRSPSVRIFHVPTTRLVSVLAGMAEVRAECSRPRSSVQLLTHNSMQADRGGVASRRTALPARRPYGSLVIKEE